MIAAALLLAFQTDWKPANLAVFNPFIGACWRTDFTGDFHDTHCFEAMYGGAHVRDRHEVQKAGKTTYAGETVFSMDGATLVYTYVNSLGGIGRGAVTELGNSNLSFEGKMRESPKDADDYSIVEWRIVDADHYQVRSPIHGWVTFTRVKLPK